MGPERSGRARVAGQELRGGPQARVVVEGAGREALEQLGLVARDVQVPQQHLRPHPRERGFAVKQRGVLESVDEGERIFPRVGRRGHERDLDAVARRHANAMAQGEDRVENCARRVGERAILDEHGRGAGRPPAAEEAGAVGLVLHAPEARARHRHRVRGERRLVLRRARPAAAEQPPASPLRLEEHLRKGGMGDVGSLRREDDFGVARHFDVPLVARPRRGVRQRDSPDLHVRLRGDDHLHARFDALVDAQEFSLVLGELRLVSLRAPERRLMPCRPSLAASHVAQVDPGAPGIGRGVVTPPGNRQAAPLGKSGTGHRHEHGVGTVRENLAARRRGIGRIEPPGRDRDFLADDPASRHLGDDRTGERGRVARDPLLQQQLGGLDCRVRVKPVSHAIREDGVVDREKDHPLVVGHERFDDGACRAGGQAPRRVVDRLVEAEVSARSLGREPTKVFRRSRRVREQREECRVGRDHELVRRNAAKAELRHAERAVLVVEVQVPGVVGGFRRAPGNLLSPDVLHLRLDRRCARLVQQRVGIRPEEDQGHQVLEHASRPGQKDRTLERNGERPLQAKPVLRRHVALGDRAEARQPSLGDQEVVVRLVQTLHLRVPADRKDLSFPVEEKREVCLVHEFLRAIRDPPEPLFDRRRVGGAFGIARERPGLPRHVAEEAEQLGERDLRVLLGERPHGVFEGRAALFDFGENFAFERIRRGGQRSEREHLISELAQRDRLRPNARGGDRIDLLLNETDQIGEPVPPGRSGRALGQLEAALLERDETCREVSAVDRRDVARRKGCEGRRVVPVVEMPAKPRERFHDAERPFEAFDEVAYPHVPEIEGRDGRQKREPDVRRRGPVRDTRLGVLLIVIGGEIVLFRVRELLEESPRQASGFAKLEHVLGGQLASLPANRPAHARGERRRDQPEEEEPGGGRQVARGDRHDRPGERCGHHPASPHSPCVAGDRGDAVLFGGGRRRPLQESPVGDQLPEKGPAGGVDRNLRKVGKEGDAKRELRAIVQQISPDAPELARPGNAPGVDGEAFGEMKDDRESDRGHRESRPEKGRAREEEPGGGEPEEKGRCEEAPPQVVEDLPSGNCRKRVRLDSSFHRHTAAEPPGDLPVSADPAVLPARVDVVGRGMVFEDLDVGCESRAGETALEQVVREDRVFRDSPGERGLERVHVVNCFSGEAALAEEVLVDVGDGGRVGVDPRVAGGDLGERRAIRAFRSDGDARLDDRAARDDAPGLRIRPRKVQRVREGPHERARGLPGKPRVGVERENEPDFRQGSRFGGHDLETRGSAAAKEAVELRQFSAFSLPPHPLPLRRVPQPLSVEKPESPGR